MQPPFASFGGKRRVAHLVWPRFGPARNYVEPFAGSLAMLLARPPLPGATEDTPRGLWGTETANDADALIANFWRAARWAPDEVAEHADWPVNEADLHARQWAIIDRLPEHQLRMHREYRYYDAEIAGLWVWGVCQWIGGAWCQVKGGHASKSSKPYLRSEGMGIGCLTPVSVGTQPDLKANRGIMSLTPTRTGSPPQLLHNGGILSKSAGPGGQIPDLGGGRGIHSHLMRSSNLYDYMGLLCRRLRRVRICCGDWTRVMGPSVTVLHGGRTAVFLDPPYDDSAGRDPNLYAVESRVSGDVRAWAIANGDDPRLRIALCGYEGEHDMPATWEKVAWKATGGYGNQRKDGTNEHCKLERIWFSPHCLRPGDGHEQLSFLSSDGHPAV